MTDFQIDKKLLNDCIEICDLDLSKLLLMNDKRFVWCILVPMRNKLSELYHLSDDEFVELNQEIKTLSKILIKKFNADKINVGSLGNIVNQLHIHIIARRVNDDAWPSPVWGYGTPMEYNPSEIKKIKNLLIEGLMIN